MNAQQLKNSILQEAIEGRLVPQDPNDEPASVLLEKIRKEKARLVKEGKLKKKDLVEIPISEEEKPFVIPKGWKWCRLGDIGIFERGSGIKRDETTDYGYPCVRYGEMYTKYKYAPTFNKTFSFTNKAVFDKCRKAHKGDLFMALTGENKQDISLAAQYIGDDEIAVGGDLCHFTILEAYALYFVYLINSKFFSSKKEKLASGDIIVHISTDKLASIAIPLPPFAEQKRIVARIEELFPKVEEYGKAQEALDKLNKDLPEKLKKSILQEAIEGRLVPQDPNDEPASVLLEKIRKEKVRLVKEGKLKKKDLVEIPISEKEKMFEVPKSWEWCSLGNIITLLSGRDLTPQDYNSLNDGIPYITGASNFEGETLIINRWTPKPVAISHYGDLLVTCKGSIGTMCFNKIGDIHIARQVMAISPYIVNVNYIKYFLMRIVYELEKKAKSIIPGISREDILTASIPLPPLGEQERIVAKIDNLLKEIDKLKV